MNFGHIVNNQTTKAEAGHLLRILLFALFFCSTTVIANDTVLQLSMVHLEGSSLNDGHLIGRGRVRCGGEQSGFRVWMAPEFLTPDKHSYVLNMANNEQVKLHIRLQGHGWQPAMTSDLGIGKVGRDSSAEFEIVANGNQLLSPGIYTLRINAACI
jgi:hypothetical protein